LHRSQFGKEVRELAVVEQSVEEIVLVPRGDVFVQDLQCAIFSDGVGEIAAFGIAVAVRVELFEDGEVDTG
jgi:hypothetical protein